MALTPCLPQEASFGCSQRLQHLRLVLVFSSASLCGEDWPQPGLASGGQRLLLFAGVEGSALRIIPSPGAESLLPSHEFVFLMLGNKWSGLWVLLAIRSLPSCPHLQTTNFVTIGFITPPQKGSRQNLGGRSEALGSSSTCQACLAVHRADSRSAPQPLGGPGSCGASSPHL